MKNRKNCQVSTTVSACFFGAAALALLFGEMNLAASVVSGVLFVLGIAVCFAGRISEF